ncbi:MAG TPA: class I tRNA ligase family protein, partial [Actinomycetota bacterium]
IVKQLRDQGLLWRTETYRHDYPHCWRCRTPLLYYALTSWYARTTARKERLLANNATIGWHPEHIRDGRFGDWLANNVDWALSRARYWGTPMPLWRCRNGHVTVVESLSDLSAKSGRDLEKLDPHRPYVDEVLIPCPECGAQARRIPDVLDAWFDSGSMPFAQWGHPHEGTDQFREFFPADFISEAIDQTRGWFYSLLAVGVLLFDATPYRNVVCLGLIVDREGRKMSKSLGNVLDPFDLLDRYGADPLRWFMLASGSPWASRRLSPEALEDITRSFFLTLWNTYSFFSMYARLAQFDPAGAGAAGLPLDELDRWILARLAETVQGVTTDLDAYDPATAARRLVTFVDDLSKWYVRLSRRRFWRTTGPESRAAFSTLWTCLRTLALLLAPYAPFVAEELWQGLVASAQAGAPDSVHLADWPEQTPDRSDAERLAAMEEARRLVRLGRQARTEAGIRVRQPLPRALVAVDAGQRHLVEPLLDLVAAELNVKEVAFAEADSALVELRLVPNFRSLGPRLGPAAQHVAQSIRTMDAETLRTVAPRILAGQSTEVDVPGVGVVTLTGDDVSVIEEPVTGWHVVREGAASVALDVHVSADLHREGIARDLVRAIQDLRKASGLAVDDRVDLAVTSSPEIQAALDAHRDYVMGETLAISLHPAPPPQGTRGGHELVVEVSGQPVSLWLRPVARDRHR